MQSYKIQTILYMGIFAMSNTAFAQYTFNVNKYIIYLSICLFNVNKHTIYVLNN